MATNPLLGVFFHWLGGLFSASCPTSVYSDGHGKFFGCVAAFLAGWFVLGFSPGFRLRIYLGYCHLFRQMCYSNVTYGVPAGASAV